MKPSTVLSLGSRLLRIISRVSITGQENIPKEGPVIFTINHLGLLDPLLGYVGAGRTDVTGWVADKHTKNPLISYFVNSLGGIWIDRENVDMQALRKAIQALKDGRLFGLAPEGTRSPTGALIPAKEGASYLALSTGAPVVAGAITGTEKVPRGWLRLTRPQIGIRIGKPFYLVQDKTKDREKAMEQATDEIMCRIAALLPVRYRGVYANHPRLKQLLTEET
ncbi:MAG: lysophospholipid acyltransferase family protein [Anaerolineales bacterium]